MKMNDRGVDVARHSSDATAAVIWPSSVDALYSDRIALLQHDPERYFKEYPRSVMP